MLHDAGSALAANDASVHRMIAIAFDVFDRAVLEIDFDPAAAGAHVACGRLDLIPGLERGVDARLGHAWLLHDESKTSHSTRVVRSTTSVRRTEAGRFACPSNVAKRQDY